MDGMPERPIAIGERIELLLAEQGKTASWLAEQAGTDRSTVHRIIAGKRKNPTPQTLSELAPALGMSLEQLVSGTDAAARVKEAANLVSRALYEEAVARMIEFQQQAREWEDRARRAEDECERERERRIEAQVVRDLAVREKKDALQAAENRQRDAEKYKQAFQRAAADVALLRTQVAELGDAIDDSRKTGRIAAALAGTAAAASVLTYLATNKDTPGKKPTGT
jgi:transcriptional regulator with XRE-family HTH domain